MCTLCILTSKCASRHNGVHFFNISTSKCSLNVACFLHFDLETRVEPQRRALFQNLCAVCAFWLGNVLRAQRRTLLQHLNFQEWSEHEVLCTFWLRSVLRATTACTFSTCQLPKVLRAWCALCILTWKCDSRHQTSCNFSSLIWPHGSAPAALASLLFDPPEPQNIGKNTVFRDFFYIFAHLHLLSSHSFSALIFSLLLFSSLTLPTSPFPSVHIVGILTSKLPSINVEVLLPKSERFPSLSNYINSCCVLGTPHQPQPFSFGWSFNLWCLSDFWNPPVSELWCNLKIMSFQKMGGHHHHCKCKISAQSLSFPFPPNSWEGYISGSRSGVCQHCERSQWPRQRRFKNGCAMLCKGTFARRIQQLAAESLVFGVCPAALSWFGVHNQKRKYLTS